MKIKKDVFKIPKKIKVGGMWWTIERVDEKNPEKNENNMGRTLFRQKKILIQKDLHHQQLENTFLHELLHVCMYESRLTWDLDDKIEESVVSRLGNVLYQVLHDNKIINK